MKRFWRRRIGLSLCILLLGLASLTTMAAKQTVLRVAFYPLEGFFEYDAQGHETGYGVELLNRITRRTGIRFTYVPAKSWESTKPMLLVGEADIRMPGTLPDPPSDTLGYTQHSILDTYYAVLTLNSRTDLIYNDFDAFENLKIAISENLYAAAPVERNLASMKLSQKNLVFYDGYNACRAALDAGEVDAVLTNIMDLDREMKLLARFSSRSNYISMTIGNPNLDVLNDAIYRIKMEDPTFFSNLYVKWFPERAIMPFTKEETAYLASLDHLCFYFGQKQGYLSHVSPDGSVQGIYPMLAQKICDQLGVACRSYDPSATALGATVVVPDFYYEYGWADQCDAALTEPYTNAGYYEITKKGASINPETARVAAVKEYRVAQDFIESGFSSDQVGWYPDYAACIEAVYDGKADVTYINRYTAEYYLDLYRYSSLSATLTDYSHQVCFAVMGENKELLASILNKCLLSVSEEGLSAIVVAQTSVAPEQDIFVEWFYQDPMRSALYTSLAAAALLLLLGFIYATHKARQRNLILQKAVHAKQDFLSRMSHDMRTPMNAIIGFSRFGIDSGSLSEAQEYHRKVFRASEYLLQLINDTLDLSKLEAGTMTIHPEPYLSSDFIETISNILLPKAKEKGISFSIENELSNPRVVLFDKLRLQQIFINLLNNAMKFTPPGGHVTLKIEAQTGEDGVHTTVFSVIDDGIGMTEAFQKESLYKPFVQEHRMENAESGTGLGLSIVKELVSAMGGTITCKSVLKEGTTFTVTLKSKVVEAPEAQAKGARPERLDLSGKRILICEDHPLNREIANKLLQNIGALVVNAGNGQAGLALFEASEVGYFDAILMDIRMPVLDGLATTRTIRALERPDAKTIPIIAMTANAFDEDVRQSIEAGMNAHLVKPIAPHRLYQTLAAFLLPDESKL